jgi:hypothetical protein
MKLQPIAVADAPILILRTMPLEIAAAIENRIFGVHIRLNQLNPRVNPLALACCCNLIWQVGPGAAALSQSSLALPSILLEGIRVSGVPHAAPDPGSKFR